MDWVSQTDAPSEAPRDFFQAVEFIRTFLGPVHLALADNASFSNYWIHPGPWRELAEFQTP